jgi:vacuolar-type H+-ATPase subunit E/Vma4
MALIDLLRALEEDGAARVAEVRARAQAEILRVRAGSEAECESRRAAALNGRETVLRAAAARELDATRRTAVARYLDARSAALARVHDRVRARLAARADDPALLPILRGDLASALEYAGDGPVVVEAVPALLEGLRTTPSGSREVRFEGTRRDGGVVVRAADGAWTVDGTFDGRLRRAWPRLAIELAPRLEPAP